MASFIIEGGHPLSGTITPQGAKNETLQVICATLLTSEPVTISNIPNIRDVQNLIQLLKDIGVKVTELSTLNTMTFQADELNLDYLQSDQFVQKCAQLRGSVMMIGPLLARMGKAVIAKPGGDKIGRRRLDTHFLTGRYSFFSRNASVSSSRTGAAPLCGSAGSAAQILRIPARAGRACLWQWRDCC